MNVPNQYNRPAVTTVEKIREVSPHRFSRGGLIWIGSILLTLLLQYSIRAANLAHDPNFMNEVFEYIRSSEYEIRWQKGVDAYQSPNRDQNLRFTYLEDGFKVETRWVEEGTPIPWRLSLRVQSFGKDSGAGKKVDRAQWAVNKRNAKAHGDCLVIDFTNNEEGMRQNFLVTERPMGAENLMIVLRAQSDELELHLDEAENCVYFAAPNSKEIAVKYSSLAVWDANGQPLDARMAVLDEHRFAILVEDDAAAYPVTVDPLVSAGVRYKDQNSAKFGYAVASSGNVMGTYNTSGGGGILVGAPYYDSGYTDQGKVFLFFSNYPTYTLASTPTWEAVIDQAYAHFGASVAGLFDITGPDGDSALRYGDIMAGAPDYDTNNLTGNGGVFIWTGSVSGLGANGTIENADYKRYGSASGDAFGSSLAAAQIRDVNNYNYSDIIVGAPNADDGNNQDAGKVYVFYGSSNGPSTSADWTKTGTYYSPYGSHFGRSLAVGNFNGDVSGYADLAVGAPNAHNGSYWVGRVYVYLSNGSGLSTTEHVIMSGQTDWGHFGFSVASTPDVGDGDSSDELIVGAPYDENDQDAEGRVFVYYGDSSSMNNTADWSAEGNQASANFGYSVAGGKLNNDGSTVAEAYGDVIVGAPYYNSTYYTDDGSVFIWLSTGSGLAATPNGQVTGLYNNANAGFSVAYTPFYAYSTPPALIVGHPGYDSGKGSVSVWEFDP